MLQRISRSRAKLESTATRQRRLGPQTKHEIVRVCDGATRQPMQDDSPLLLGVERRQRLLRQHEEFKNRGDFLCERAFYVFLFLLCSLLAVPILGASNAHAATIVNFEGGCLSDQFSDTADHNPIVVVTCFDGPFRQWKWERLAIQGLVARDSNKFLDVGDGSHFTQARIRTCNFALAATGQRWSIHSVEFQNDSSFVHVPLCLDVRGAETANGTPVRGFVCNASFAQVWNFEGLAIQGIGSTSAGAKCLDVVGGGTADGTHVQLFDCNGTGAQQWNY
jgi:Ricin-type beta-trefoil lectin domain